MNDAAPEVLAESVTPTSAGEATVTRHGEEPDARTKATTFECLFCRRTFDELPFYGCCGGCYTKNAEVRALVDEAHPQTTVQW